jgi:hypothetical protein
MLQCLSWNIALWQTWHDLVSSKPLFIESFHFIWTVNFLDCLTPPEGQYRTTGRGGLTSLRRKCRWDTRWLNNSTWSQLLTEWSARPFSRVLVMTNISVKIHTATYPGWPNRCTGTNLEFQNGASEVAVRWIYLYLNRNIGMLLKNLNCCTFGLRVWFEEINISGFLRNSVDVNFPSVILLVNFKVWTI